MSRLFNGTNQSLRAALDLTAYAKVSLSFWMWWDSFATLDRIAVEFQDPSAGAGKGFYVAPTSAPTAISIFDGLDGSHVWSDRFATPSAAAWHHYLVTYDRVATQSNTAFVDGAAQTLTTVSHQTGSVPGNFANNTLNFMARAHASLWAPGRLAHVALWGGTILTARNALALSVGASPMRIGPVPNFYWPLWGDAADADYGGLRKTVTLTGTPTVAAHPPVMVSAF